MSLATRDSYRIPNLLPLISFDQVELLLLPEPQFLVYLEIFYIKLKPMGPSHHSPKDQGVGAGCSLKWCAGTLSVSENNIKICFSIVPWDNL